jgi:predicted NUDIX family NTP pyrophosphohydrolase
VGGSQVSAGCLVRATFDGVARYLIVHPSGNYNRRAPYSIPKGIVAAGERPEEAAVRETREETGIPCRIVATLGEIRYRKTRKTVIAFLAEPLVPVPDPTVPPGDWEIDRAEFLPAAEARRRLHPDQRPFIDRAVAALEAPGGG